VTVSELVEILNSMPQGAIVCNYKPTSLNTWVTIRRCGTVDVIPILGRLTEPEYRVPLNAWDEPTTERVQIVVIG